MQLDYDALRFMWDLIGRLAPLIRRGVFTESQRGSCVLRHPLFPAHAEKHQALPNSGPLDGAISPESRPLQASYTSLIPLRRKHVDTHLAAPRLSCAKSHVQSSALQLPGEERGEGRLALSILCP